MALVVGACPDGDSSPANMSAPGAVDTGDATTSPDVSLDSGPADDSGGCVPGNQGCACLEGACIGGLFCVEDECALGPQVEVDEGREVIAGLVVPVSADVMAEEFSWTQAGGPTVEILGATTLEIAVVLPTDIAAGEVVTLRLTALRNSVTVEADVELTIIDETFEDFLSGVEDPAELGTPDGIDFDAAGMWVVSNEGFVSLFDGEGTLLQSYPMSGAPAGANFSGENLIIANREVGSPRVDQLNSVSGNVSNLFSLDAEGPGEVELPLPDTSGNVYVSTGVGGRVLRWDAKRTTTSEFLSETDVLDPGAMAFGPEGNAIYVGGSGMVWRVPLLEGGMAGEPETYLELDATCRVEGLVFDEGSSLWVGCPDTETLVLARYSAEGPTEVRRSWSAPAAGRSRFNNLHFGRGQVEGRWLYWTNLADGSVGRLVVGVSELDAPLAN